MAKITKNHEKHSWDLRLLCLSLKPIATAASCLDATERATISTVAQAQRQSALVATAEVATRHPRCGSKLVNTAQNQGSLVCFLWFSGCSLVVFSGGFNPTGTFLGYENNHSTLVKICPRGSMPASDPQVRSSMEGEDPLKRSQSKSDLALGQKPRYPSEHPTNGRK